MKSNWGLLGHAWAVELLKGHLKRGAPRHAYLFTGPQSVGRRTLALLFAQALNAQSPGEPGEFDPDSRRARQIADMQHPDLFVVEAEREGGTLKVDQIRELQRSLALTPYEASYQVALLLRFEEANPSAANALLKTLEEPPPSVVLMLTAPSTEALLPTIASRCEVLRLRPLPLNVVEQGLVQEWAVPPEDARLLAAVSGGRPGYALRLHQQRELRAQRSARLDEQQALLQASRRERFAYAEALAKDKEALQSVLQLWLSFWRDVLLRGANSQTPLTNLDREEEIRTLAQSLDLARAHAVVTSFERTLGLMRTNVNARLATEVLLMDLPQL